MSTEEKKLIFIVTPPEAPPSEFVAYLKAKKWTVETTSDISKALPFIFNNPIHCVMISADHPHPKTLKLPGTIGRTVNTPVIMYSEGLIPEGAENLKASKHPYTLSAPVKGPDIERMMAKIERAQGSMSGANFKRKNSKGESIVIGGTGKNFSDEAIVQKGFSAEDLDKLLDGDDSVAESIVQKGAANEVMQATQEGTPGELLNSGASASSLDPALASEQGATPNQNQYNEVQGAGAPAAKIAEENLDPSKLSHEQYISLLNKAAQHAIVTVAVKNLGISNPVHKVIDWRPLSFYKLQSDLGNGVLVVSFGAQNKNNQDFDKKLQTHFTDYLEQQGLFPKIQELKKIQLPVVNFEKFATEQGVFFKTADHPENEVALSFFELPPQNPQMEISEDKEMLRLNLEEIEIRFPLPFDLFIYLPLNKRYVRNVARDKVMSEKQFLKMIESGMKDAYIRKDAEKDFIKFKIKNVLSDKIADYQKKNPK